MRAFLTRRIAAARARSEEGVFALLTGVFLILVGSFCIAGLWTIAYVSGAHTTLYAAAQSAAYTAATEVDFDSTAHAVQFGFLCQDGYDGLAADPWCNGGRTFAAADAMLRLQLQGQFGLTMGSSVGYADSNGNAAPGIRAYQIDISAGDAQASAGGGCIQDNGGAGLTRVCWQVPGELGESTQTSYSSGVLVGVSAQVKAPFLSGCSIPVICDPVHIHVSVPAAQAQQEAPLGYR